MAPRHLPRERNRRRRHPPASLRPSAASPATTTAASHDKTQHIEVARRPPPRPHAAQSHLLPAGAAAADRSAAYGPRPRRPARGFRPPLAARVCLRRLPAPRGARQLLRWVPLPRPRRAPGGPPFPRHRLRCAPRACPGSHETVHERHLRGAVWWGWRGGGGGEGGRRVGAVPDGAGAPGRTPAPVRRVPRSHERSARRTQVPRRAPRRSPRLAWVRLIAINTPTAIFCYFHYEKLGDLWCLPGTLADPNFTMQGGERSSTAGSGLILEGEAGDLA